MLAPAILVIRYDVPSDYADAYMCIVEETTLKSVSNFEETAIKVFGDEYPRHQMSAILQGFGNGLCKRDITQFWQYCKVFGNG